MQWAFMTANYVGRALGYANNTDWTANHNATVAAFHGPQFGARFAEMIDEITAAGFDAIELWVAHLDPLLATPEMIATANQILRERGVKLTAYTAGFGRPGVSREDATRIFETGKARLKGSGCALCGGRFFGGTLNFGFQLIGSRGN